MTWFAHHLFCTPNKELLKIISKDSALFNQAYLIDDITDFSWPDSQKKHELPEDGLLVLRFGKEVNQNTNWDHNRSYRVEISPAEVQKDYPDFNLSNYPQISFLNWIKGLNQATESPLAYYYCEMWAGDVELEYAWVFSKIERVFTFTSFHQGIHKLNEYTKGTSPINKHGDVLVETMTHFGIKLPTSYFALHTRSFPWSNYKLETSTFLK